MLRLRSADHEGPVETDIGKTSVEMQQNLELLVSLTVFAISWIQSVLSSHSSSQTERLQEVSELCRTQVRQRLVKMLSATKNLPKDI